MKQKFPNETMSNSRHEDGPLGIDARLASFAIDQIGVFTSKQAADIGVTRTMLFERRSAGVIVPMFSGVYRIAAVEATSEQLTLAACLSVANAVVSGRSAALVHGLPIRSNYDTRPTLILPHESRSPAHAAIDVRRTRHPYLTQPWRSVRITQVSSTLIALASLLPQPELARCFDHAVAHRLVSAARLLKEVESRPTSRFVGRAMLLDEIHARLEQPVIHRSGYEQRVSRWIRESGLPLPRTNYRVPIAGRNTSVEVDNAWPAERVALEISPFFTHGSAATQRRDMTRRMWLQESDWRFVEATDEHLVDRKSFAPIIDSIERLLRERP